MTDPRRGLGNLGENLAADFLQKNGYVIRERNYRVPRLGELDIVAVDGNCLVYVEVRTRRGRAYGTPEDSITVAKKLRLVQLAMSYRQSHAGAGLPEDERIDVVAVEMTPAGRLLRIEIIKNAVGV
jgi:putative endonuclease